MFTRNRIELTGNVAKSPESRTVGETTVTKARLMHNETIRRNEGDPIERLVAVDLEIWGKRGEAFARHITTKTPVHIEGRLQLDQWQADGEPRSRLLIRVDDWQFIAPKAQGNEEGGKAAATAVAKPSSKRKAA
jgi:single stranded DNA-binding protein